MILAAESVLALGARLVISLGIVLGVMWGFMWLARHRGRGGFGFGMPESAIQVLGREHLNRTSTVALLRVGQRAVLVGVSDQGVAVLSEGDDLIASIGGDEEDEEDVAADDLSLQGGDRMSPVTRRNGRDNSRMTLIEVLRERSVRRS